MNLLKLLSLLIYIPCAAQGNSDMGFTHETLPTTEWGTISFHLSSQGSDQKKPLLVYLDGSGNYPIFYKTKQGRYSTSVPLRTQSNAANYHIVLISKPGIPFKDSLRYDASGFGRYPSNNEYDQRYSLDWRAGTASTVIHYLMGKIPVDSSKIIVMGYSEGSQVAPRVAVLNKHVTHVVCFGGNALNHLYDFLLEARLRAERGEISRAESQRQVDSLYAEYEKIFKSPSSTEQRWYGATYKKWSSFSKTTPLENMLQLSIPILYVAGGRDRNQTIMDMDYARLEFIRKGKTNLTYKVYPDCDHFFQELLVVNGEEKRTDRIDEVHQFALEWIKGK